MPSGPHVIGAGHAFEALHVGTQNVSVEDDTASMHVASLPQSATEAHFFVHKS